MGRTLKHSVQQACSELCLCDEAVNVPLAHLSRSSRALDVVFDLLGARGRRCWRSLSTGGCP